MEYKIKLIATSTFGLESILAKEVKALGFKDVEVENGKVTFPSDLQGICKSNIWLRTADRVLLKIGEFKATSFEELFENTKKLPWYNWIPENGEFPVTKAKSVNSKLYSLSDCQSIVKKAVVESLKEKYKVKWFSENGPKYPIMVSINKDIVTLTIDTSGDGLHKRGYRSNPSLAPIKETLAAGLVLLSKWSPDYTLIDPFCGSGTIPIEAAMIGRNIAPGLQRNFISHKWPKIPTEYWDNTKKESLKKIDQKTKVEILASDVDKKAINSSNENAFNAGVDDCIKFQKLSFQEFSSKKKYCYIITNPPFGERIGEKKDIEILYKKMGEKLHPFDTWSIFILTSHLEFERIFNKKAHKNRKLYNGKILTYFYQYFGPKPKSQLKNL